MVPITDAGDISVTSAADDDEVFRSSEQRAWVAKVAPTILSPAEGKVIALRLQGFESNADLAVRLGMSSGSVAVHLCNAIRKLREAAKSSFGRNKS